MLQGDVQWRTGHRDEWHERDESRWAGTEVGRSDHVGRSDKSLADNLLAVFTCGTEVGPRYRSWPVESPGLIFSPSPPLVMSLCYRSKQRSPMEAFQALHTLQDGKSAEIIIGLRWIGCLFWLILGENS